MWRKSKTIQTMTASCQNCLSWGNTGNVSHPPVLDELGGVTSPQGVFYPFGSDAAFHFSCLHHLDLPCHTIDMTNSLTIILGNPISSRGLCFLKSFNRISLFWGLPTPLHPRSRMSLARFMDAGMLKS